MNRKLLSALIIAGAAMGAQHAAASDGTITFNGDITAQTCTINGAGSGSSDFLVTLPTVSVSALDIDGKPAGATGFKIELTGCTPDSGSVHTFFEAGATTDLATGNLIVDAGAGAATNVQIRLKNNDGSIIKAGFADASQNSKVYTITGGSAVMDYIAEYVAVGGPATAGAANSSVVYSLAYN